MSSAATEPRLDQLRAQLDQIDRLIAECAGNPNLERLIEHLNGRRNTTLWEIEKIEVNGG